MERENFVGRKNELDTLFKAIRSRKSEFIPIYGRRRVGKTALIRQILNEYPGFYYSGLRLRRQPQLRSFMRAAGRAFGKPLLEEVNVNDWQQAIEILFREWPDQLRAGKKQIFVLDEFQWIAESGEELASVLQQIWDQRWEHGSNVVLILCGSYVGFMEREVLGKKSPLFGRRTRLIKLPPLPPDEARLMHPNMNLENAASTYFICGGVPAYHRAFLEKASLPQNIASSFFSGGVLEEEPTFLLREELRDVPAYFSIMAALARGSLTRKDLAESIGMPPTTLDFYIGELSGLGYVGRRYPLGQRKPSPRSVRLVLTDPLLKFWFRFIEDCVDDAAIYGSTRAVAERIVPELPGYLGNCFESLCRKALPFIYAREKVIGKYEVGEYWSKKVQIDIVCRRKDGFVDFGECKWGTNWSRKSLAEEIHKKSKKYPLGEDGSVILRAFVRKLPKGKNDYGIIWYTLADVYDAMSTTE